jgi:hypothetical protein
MDARAVRAYVERDWAAAAASKQDHWAAQFAARGAEATLGAAEALWRYMRELRPEWPTDDDRRVDLEHHVAMKRALDRAARALGTLTAR